MINFGEEVVLRKKDFPALPRDYTVSRIDLRISRKFKEYVKACEGWPDTLTEDLFNSLPREEQIARRKRAEETNEQLRCFTIQCPLAMKYLAREEGAAFFAKLVLEKHQPDITEEEAFDVFMIVGPAWQEALQKAQGDDPFGARKASA